MNEEQKISIIKNGQYNNIKLQELSNGNHTIKEKTFVEGMEIQGKFGLSYSCKANYNSEEVSFWLNPKQHEQYISAGGIGDKIKITLNLDEMEFDKKDKQGQPVLDDEGNAVKEKKAVRILSFEKVE